MKKNSTLIFISLIFLTHKCFCQYHTTYKDEYGRKIGESDTRVVPSSRLEPVQQQIISSYVPSGIDPNLLLQAGATLQKRHEENLKYLNALLEWVLELKQMKTDKILSDNLNIYYSKLREYDGAAFR